MTNINRLGADQSHLVRRRVIDAILDAETVEDAADSVMEALNQMRIVAYLQPDQLELLTASGRVLTLIMENPEATHRELACRMGLMEQNVQRAMTKLVDAGLVQRQKRGMRNHYTVVPEVLWSHPDIWRLGFVLAEQAESEQK